MKNPTPIAAATIVVLSLGAHAAQAGLAVFEDPAIYSPIDGARVDIYWVDSSAGYTGELRWVDTAFEGAPQALWTNKSAAPNQRHTLPRLFGQGERVDFVYEIVSGALDSYFTGTEHDWSQFVVDDSDPFDVLVGVEDIRFPDGDMDHNDAVFRVVFSQAATPTPGTLSLLGGGCLAMVRRRRR